MLTQLLVAVGMLLAQQPAAAPVPVSLEVHVRLSIQKVDAALDAAASPYSNFGPLLAQLLTPEGPVDIQYLIAPDESRAVLGRRFATLPGGTIVLEHAGDGAIRVVNPENKTWYEISASKGSGPALGAPTIQIQPANDAAMIAGQQAAHSTFTETLSVPPPQGAAVPAAFPAQLRLTGDLWTTDAFAGSGYAAAMKTLQAFASFPGIDALTAGGRFPLRLVLRSNVMPGYEIRSDVMAVQAVTPDPTAFAVPTGYLHVMPPGEIANVFVPSVSSCLDDGIYAEREPAETHARRRGVRARLRAPVR
ncbi:MAG TPA: hypothetical protein VGL62_16805 [Vicinamibacterales bacterium]|jgi:hypothetical protein